MTVITRFNFPDGLEGGDVTQAQSGSPAETALATLREHCSPEQQATLDASRGFEAVGPSGMRYALALTEKTVEVRWQSQMHGCWLAVVKGRAATLPVGDLALLAKLAIENAEQWWQVAGNRCGSVWVEDRSSALHGSYTDVFGHRYQWTGQQWQALA